MIEQSRIAVFGLEDALNEELRSVLDQRHYKIYSQPYRSASDCVEAIRKTRANIAFCPAAPDLYRPLLEALRKRSSRIPVIVVSRLAEVPQWLDAMEAGASDYCSAPFEAKEIGWILENALKARAAAAA
jgi:DNA-binding NtrC family response regulator